MFFVFCFFFVLLLIQCHYSDCIHALFESEWIMSQLLISDVAGRGGKKADEETPSSRAVGGTVAPGTAADFHGALLKDN